MVFWFYLKSDNSSRDHSGQIDWKDVLASNEATVENAQSEDHDEDETGWY